jgi:hypothetical protein
MTVTKQFDEDVDLRRYEYDDSLVVAADFGPEHEATVDVVDGTVMVIVDGEQYDLDVKGDARAFIRNGVLTIEVDR